MNSESTAVKLLSSTAFMMSVALIISICLNLSGAMDGVFADDGLLPTGVRGKITIFLLAAMMTVTLSRIPYRNLNPLKHWKSVMRAILLGLVFAGSIPLIFYFILKNVSGYEDYAVGLVFVAAAPFAASVGPLTLIMKGDLESSLRDTVSVYFVSLLWVPFICWLCLDRTIIDMTNVVKVVFVIIGIPLLLSRLFTKVKIDGTIMALILNITIGILIFLSVSSAALKTAGLTVFLVFSVVALLRDFGLGNTTEFLLRKKGMPLAKRTPIILEISYKNKGICMSLAAGVLVGPAIPSAMVCITASIVCEVLYVIYLDSYLLSPRRAAKEHAREEKLEKA